MIAQLRSCEVAALAFCRLLESWARGEADPCTPGKRQAALRRAAERVEVALTGLEEPLGRLAAIGIDDDAAHLLRDGDEGELTDESWDSVWHWCRDVWLES